MIKIRSLFGYLIVIAVLIAFQGILSQMEVSPWFNIVAVILAISAAVNFVDSLSVTGIGLLVEVLTILLPLILLFVMGVNSGLSPLSYFNMIDILQHLLPMLTAIIFLTVLKRFKAKREKK